MYRGLHDDLSLDDLLNLEEIDLVARTHRDAMLANVQESQPEPRR